MIQDADDILVYVESEQAELDRTTWLGYDPVGESSDSSSPGSPANATPREAISATVQTMTRGAREIPGLVATREQAPTGP